MGGGNGNPLQCSCLENPRDCGAWWAAVYGVSQSRTRLKRLSSSGGGSSSRSKDSSGTSRKSRAPAHTSVGSRQGVNPACILLCGCWPTSQGPWPSPLSPREVTKPHCSFQTVRYQLRRRPGRGGADSERVSTYPSQPSRDGMLAVPSMF